MEFLKKEKKKNWFEKFLEKFIEEGKPTMKEFRDKEIYEEIKERAESRLEKFQEIREAINNILFVSGKEINIKISNLKTYLIKEDIFSSLWFYELEKAYCSTGNNIGMEINKIIDIYLEALFQSEKIYSKPYMDVYTSAEKTFAHFKII